jgi:extracellular elastinolytic metalloproteinase
VLFEDPPAFGGGIRPFPYSTDMRVNPQTYGDLAEGTLSVPHGTGSVWATALWEMHWALVNGVRELRIPGAGFRENLYDLSQPVAGNQIALRLVMDGLKLQPCLPTFLDARDAILAADKQDFGGAHACAIWWAFAKRGMGVNADDGGDPLGDSLAVKEDFTLPASCTKARGGGG